jgi:hypothetical protein
VGKVVRQDHRIAIGNARGDTVFASVSLDVAISTGQWVVVEELIAKIRSALTPDLLKPSYQEENAGNPMFGHCYVATEALFHLLPDRKNYCACRGRDDRGIVHWWLVNRTTNEIYDVTADQYLSKGLDPPYARGKRSGFLTNDPSKRCRMLLDRVQRFSS